MNAPSGVITLTTDFGVQDSYVGTMKGVILRINPSATMVDLTHQISPQAVLEASLVLESAYRFFPLGTIHLTVVDPGVGTHRRAILVEAGGFYFVGPDNGIFTRVLEAEADVRVFELTNPSFMLPRISDTFMGAMSSRRSPPIFAGDRPGGIRALVEHPVELALPQPRRWGPSCGRSHFDRQFRQRHHQRLTRGLRDRRRRPAVRDHDQRAHDRSAAPRLPGSGGGANPCPLRQRRPPRDRGGAEGLIADWGWARGIRWWSPSGSADAGSRAPVLSFPGSH
ncbi:MAG: SAM-dependent chlorinase/fluorinase [Candidatus Eisenbacteria bacterium]